MKSSRILMVFMLVFVLVAGCSQETDMTAPENQATNEKDGSEVLGPPTIDIATGTCFAQGGVGMVGRDVGALDIDVPPGEIKQVLLYWSGGTTGADGDNMIKIDDNEVTGIQIGGPTNFFTAGGVKYYFTAFRADITELALVGNGANSFEISDFDFDFSGGPLDENHGCGIMVIYDDGNLAEIQIVDGLDVAFFRFDGDLQVTEPQSLAFTAEGEDRFAKVVIFAGSVGAGRPNEIHLTTSAGTDVRADELQSADDNLWDTLCLEDVYIPAGDTSITIELISTPSEDPLGASLTWIGCGLSVPVTPPTYCIGDYVWYDTNGDGCQDPDEMPAAGVEVILHMDLQAQEADSEVSYNKSLSAVMTDEFGYYEFCGLMPGKYRVRFVAPEGYYFCEPYSEICDEENDSNADSDGFTDLISIVDADDWTIDAALCMPPPEGCLLIIDEDGIDNDMRSIERAARGHGVESDWLINDDRPTEVGNPHFRWNTMFPGDVVLLPTGEVDDEGWFALPENTPWSVEEFAAGTVPQDRLDKIRDVMPLRNQELVQLVGRTCTAVVYDSDISMNYDPINGNLQGARYGLFTFTVLAVEVPGELPEAQSSTSLYSLWVRVEEPQMPTGNFEVPVRDHEPDAVEINRSRYSNGQLVVYGESDFSPTAYMTISVDGPDMGSDLGVPPFLLEQPMTYTGGRYEFTMPTGENLNGRRVTISTDAGGSYTEYIE